MTAISISSKIRFVAVTAAAGLLFASALVLSAPRVAVAGGAGDPAGFVRAFGERAVAVLADQSLAPEARAEEFRQLLIERFDVARIGRFALGRYWRKATKEQRAEYARVFEDYIIATYARKLNAYSGETFAVDSVRNQDKKRARVVSRIVRAEGEPIMIEWRLRRADGSWRIVDVMVEGVSMAMTQRSEFAAVVRANGGRVDGLIEKLREKTAPVKSAAVEKGKSTL